MNDVSNATSPQLTIPSGAPHNKFTRYARSVSSDHTHLFPMVPTTRPLVVGIDLRTLGMDPRAYPDLLEIARRRDIVAVKLLIRRNDDAAIAESWMQAIEIDELHTLSFTDRESASRFGDALEFSVHSTRAGQIAAMRMCRFFDIYTVLDAHDATTTDLSDTDRLDAAVLAAVGYALGTDVIVSLAPTVGRADVADNDVVTTVTPEDLAPVFGHYLRMTGNCIIAQICTGRSVNEVGARSITEFYANGVAAVAPLLDTLHLAARLAGKTEAAADVETVQARLRRAARALDEVLAALARTNGRDIKPTVDTVESVSEAFDRELLYLIAVFDTYARAYLRWMYPTESKPLLKSLHSKTTLTRYVDPHYPGPVGADLLRQVHELQQYAFICSQLRNRIHAAMLPTAPFANRAYGSAQAIAIDLSAVGIEPNQQQTDRLGVWKTELNPLSAETLVVADIATAAVELFITAAEYVDVFSRLILTIKPVGAPDADNLLGMAADDTGAQLPPPASIEQRYRDLFGWKR
ncbi:hypothetical protein [Nocardia sp. NPDC056000]|uniref:hypothetical protein n=1 Tax=Nocardia sp. NPDC056000 TaxID=3345674 RepID=UPI0035D9027D